MNGDWEMPSCSGKWEFGNAAPPGDQSPGYGERTPPESGSFAERGTPARNSRRSYSQNRACALTGFSRFPPDVARDFSPWRKQTRPL